MPVGAIRSFESAIHLRNRQPLFLFLSLCVSFVLPSMGSSCPAFSAFFMFEQMVTRYIDLEFPTINQFL